MLVIKMKRILIFYCLFFSVLLQAQSLVKPELKKVNQAYLTAADLSMDITVFMYKNKVDKTGSLLGNGWMKKSGKNYHSKFGTDEMLINAKTTLIIDNKKKQITFFEPNNTKIKTPAQLPNIDSMLTVMDSVIYKGEDGDSKHFCFYSAGSPIKQTDIYVYKKNSFVKRIIYYYKENSKEENYDMYKIINDYKNIKLDKLTENEFSENKYITIEQGKVKVAPAYQSYKLNLSENE